MASSRAISAGDPQAVEKLNARLQECREYQVQKASTPIGEEPALAWARPA